MEQQKKTFLRRQRAQQTEPLDQWNVTNVVLTVIHRPQVFFVTFVKSFILVVIAQR